MKSIRVVILLGLLCSGCAVEPEKDAPLGLWSHPEVRSKEGCEAIGGHWFRSRSGDFLCDERTSDAGKTCHDSSECEGSCVTALETSDATETPGRCDTWHIDSERCVNEVRNGRATGKHCDRQTRSDPT